MAVNFVTSRRQYSGNGSSATPYPVKPDIEYFDETDLKVVVTDPQGMNTILTRGTDFVVTDEGVVTAAPVSGGSQVTIYRELDAVQPTSYNEADAFPASSHERALDRLTMLVQQAIRQIEASFRFRESDGVAGAAQRVDNSMFGLSAGGLPIFRTADEAKAWLSLAEPILNYPTKVWADDAARAVAVPDFQGQVGTQVNTAALYVASGLAAGNWLAVSTTLPDGYLAANSVGRAKMADGYLLLAKMAAGIFTADDAGRGKFANGFVNDALLSAALNFSGKTLTMPAGHWSAIAPAGAVLQTLQKEYPGTAQITATIALGTADTKPQSSEGTEILSQAITPASSSNRILVRFSAFGSRSSAQAFTAALFVNDDAYAVQVSSSTVPAGNSCASICFEFLHSPGVAGVSTTYKVRVGPDSNWIRINGVGNNPGFGGAGRATLTLQEIKG